MGPCLARVAVPLDCLWCEKKVTKTLGPTVLCLSLQRRLEVQEKEIQRLIEEVEKGGLPRQVQVQAKINESIILQLNAKVQMFPFHFSWPLSVAGS